MRIIKLISTLFMVILLASCVSQSRYVKLNMEKLKLENDRFNAQSAISELESQLQAIESRNATLEQEYTDCMNSSEKMRTLMRAREDAIKALKEKLTDALYGFEGKGINITTRDGKVYVSMENKLLFSSGSFEIGEEGERAVRNIAEVLSLSKDINIMVEGHTDNVPYKTSSKTNIEDNWDLSVKRATTVTRLLLSNHGIAPSRVTAAGRSEFSPIAEGNTPAARQKNRRTEIILAPNLDQLMELMNEY